MENQLKVTTSDKYSFFSIEKKNERYFNQINFTGKLLLTGKESAALVNSKDILSIKSINVLNSNIHQKLHFVVSCLKKRCSELHYEIYQTADDEILLYYIAGKSLNNLEPGTFKADYMVFSDSPCEKYASKDPVMDIDPVQHLTNAISIHYSPLSISVC